MQIDHQLSQQQETLGLKYIETFEKMNLNPKLLKSISQYGLSKPSKVQQKAILPFINGKDLIVRSVSGSGKTICYLISLLQLIDPKCQKLQCLILTYCRERAQAVNKLLSQLGKIFGIHSKCCVGGVPFKQDTHALRNLGVQAAVGTPGRMCELLSPRYQIDGSRVKTIVIDEADQLINRGFIFQIRSIRINLFPQAQLCLFSPTFSYANFFDFQQLFHKDTVKILIDYSRQTSSEAKQFYIDVENDSEKNHMIVDLCKKMMITKCIIYTKTKERGYEIYETLCKQQFSVSLLAKDQSLQDKNKIISKFKQDEIRVLISIDVFIDIECIQSSELIVNQNIPKYEIQYLSRISGIGNYLKKRNIVNLVNSNEKYYFDKLNYSFNNIIQQFPKSN